MENLLNVPIHATHNFTREELSDVLAAAFEGGIGYWACLCNRIKPDDREGLDHDDIDLPAYCYYPLTDTGAVLLCDAEDDGISVDGWPEQYWVLDKDAITRGLSLTAVEYPASWSALTTGEYDAGDADIVIQLAIFGKVVYG